MWIWLVALIIVIILLVLIVYISSKTVVPNSGIVKYRKIANSDLDTSFKYSVYFSLKNLNKLESLEGGDIISPSDMKNYLENQTAAINWLRNYGTILNSSDSGTMVLFETTARQLLSWNKNLDLYIFNESQLGTYNNYVKFPSGVVFNYFNFVNVSLNSKTAKEWVDELKFSELPLQNNYVQPTSLDTIRIENPSINSRPLGFIDFGAFNDDELEGVCVYLGLDYNEILNNIKGIYINSNLEPTEITTVPWTDPSGLKELPINGDITIALSLSLGLNPDNKFVGYVTSENISDLNLLLWNEWKNPNSPRVITGLTNIGSAKIDPRDFSRVGYETRLLSLCGYRLIAPSGYTGAYIIDQETSTFDINYPDLPINILYGQGVVTVGGVEKSGNVYSGFSTPPPMATSGGYKRGYPPPNYKQNFTIQDDFPVVYKDGIHSVFIPNLDYNGDYTPDISALSSFSLGQSGGATSVVLAAVYASNYIYDQDPIIKSSLQKIMYKSKVRPTRPVQGTNAIFNMPGFRAVSNSWDPVQGLGLLTPEYIAELFNT